MNPLRRCLTVCLATCLLGPAARADGFLPALMVEPIELAAGADLSAYATQVAEANALMRTRHQVPLFLRAYAAYSITGDVTAVFALSPSATFAGLDANRAQFASDSALAGVRVALSANGRPGAATYLKAVRFDGTHAPGSLVNAWVNCPDEAALLAVVAGLAQRWNDPAATAPVYLNVFRVVAGPGPATHLVSVNADSPAQLARVLDAWGDAGTRLNTAISAPLSTTVYRELVP